MSSLVKIFSIANSRSLSVSLLLCSLLQQSCGKLNFKFDGSLEAAKATKTTKTSPKDLLASRILAIKVEEKKKHMRFFLSPDYPRSAIAEDKLALDYDGSDIDDKKFLELMDRLKRLYSTVAKNNRVDCSKLNFITFSSETSTRFVPLSQYSDLVGIYLNSNDSDPNWIMQLARNPGNEPVVQKYLADLEEKRRVNVPKNFGPRMPFYNLAKNLSANFGAGTELKDEDVTLALRQIPELADQKIVSVRRSSKDWFHAILKANMHFDQIEVRFSDMKETDAVNVVRVVRYIKNKIFDGQRLSHERVKKITQVRPSFNVSLDAKGAFDAGEIYTYEGDFEHLMSRSMLNRDVDVYQVRYVNRDVMPLNQVYDFMNLANSAFSGLEAFNYNTILDAAAKISAEGTLVAVLDSGVDYNHPLLAYKTPRDADGKTLGYDFDDNDERPYDYYSSMSDRLPAHDHGTHVAGIVAQVPHVALVPVKYDEHNPARMENAIDLAASRNVRVINVSLGSDDEKDWPGFLRGMKKHPEIIFVIASGNEAMDFDHSSKRSYPACYSNTVPNAIVVASVDDKGKASDFSNIGAQFVHIAAPGEKILSTTPERSFGKKTGTSMATPYVTGTVAEMLYQNPNLQIDQIKDILQKTCKKSADLAGKVAFGCVVDRDAAINAARSSGSRQ